MMLDYLPPFLSPLHSLIIGSSLLEYNVHHLFNRAKNGPLWSRWALHLHWMLSGIGLLLCALALPYISLKMLIVCAILGAVSLAYSTPLLPFRYKRRLKDYGLLKIHVLTLVWVLVSTVLPALYWRIPFRDYWLETVLRFLLIFPLCIAFDIRDWEPDLAKDIHTLPNTLGLPAAYRAIDFTLATFLVWGGIHCAIVHRFAPMIRYIISAAAAHFIIRYSRRNAHPYVYLLGIDGVMLLYGALQCIL